MYTNAVTTSKETDKKLNNYKTSKKKYYLVVSE